MRLAPASIAIGAALLLSAVASLGCGGGKDHGRIHDVVYVSESQGQRLFMLTTGGDDEEISSEPSSDPSWAPNLSRLAYLANPQDGKGTLKYWDRREARPLVVPDSPPNVSRFEWSPDSRKIAYQADRSDGSVTEIYMHDLEEEITVLVSSEPVGNLQMGNWSGDTEWLAIRLVTDDTVGIFMRSVHGVNEIQLTDGADFSPRFSPDGQRLAFARSQSDGTTDIYSMLVEDGDGPGKAVNLTRDPGDEVDFEWSPDNKSIAYQSSRAGNSEIYIVDVESAETRRLTNNRVNDSSPRWSRNAGHVLFVSDADGDRDVYSMDIGSEVQRNLTATDSEEWDADW